jgi:uncharacterized protein
MSSPEAWVRLEQVVRGLSRPAIAVSGGIDSLTLATFAARTLGARNVMVVHAVSPAVPAEATARVRDATDRHAWTLDIVDTGEFSDRLYLDNPLNRCFHCKMYLYSAIATRTDRTILAGTNIEDLGEFRPGLDAARRYSVHHPFVEAGFDKAAIRGLAHALGMGTLAELPASPCLSSRVETGIPIRDETLRFVHETERSIAASDLRPHIVRCRIRSTGVVVELDEESLNRLSLARRKTLGEEIHAHMPASMRSLAVGFAAYRRGSAFVAATFTPQT